MTGARRPAMAVGQTYCDQIGQKVSWTVLASDATGATVRVRYGRCR